MRKQRNGSNAPDLHCHSNYSLLDGHGTPKQVVQRAVELGWGAAALCEHGWLGSAPAFYQACRAEKINPIIGCEMYVVPENLITEGGTKGEHSHHLTALALSREGYQNLIAWNNRSMTRPNFHHTPRISFEEMLDSAPWPLHHNVVLSGCISGELCETLRSENGNSDAMALAYVEGMREVFPNFFIEVQDHRIDKFLGRGFDRYEGLIEAEFDLQRRLINLAIDTGTPFVLTNDSHYQTSDQRKAHVAMMASKLGRWGKDSHRDDEHQAAAYVRDYSYWASYMRSLEQVGDRHLWGPEAVGHAKAIAEAANIVLDPLDKFEYSIPFSGYDEPIEEIRRRTKSMLKRAIAKHGDAARVRFEHELKAMGDFGHYLLLNADLIRHCKETGILTNTRGSAANSLVNFCLGIHDIDPMPDAYDLMFERFVNPERAKNPDIDIDIEKDRYDDVTRWVGEHITKLEGEHQVAQIANYGTLANRGAFRMAAEALGMPKEKQDEVAQLLPQMIDSGVVDEEDDVYEALKEEHPEMYELVSGVFDAPKNVSQHACGWLIGTRERPLPDWVPLYLIASSNTLVTQYDYKLSEKFGLVKLDLLRLKTLNVISRCLKMLGKNPLDLAQIPLDDKETFAMLREGRTDGIFTLQGKTNRAGCMECEVSSVHDVIASVAIYRPALTRPGYHKVYNARRRGEEKVKYPHPIAESILGPTHGLPIFQEQILQLAKAIGFSDGESQDYLDAIKLAKGIGRGATEAFEKLHPGFIERATQNGLTKNEAEGVWDFVGSFKGYGFNKGHATSYGILSVRAAYLKCHHPLEFFTALLDVYPEAGHYVAAARGEGFKIVPPDVNRSAAGFSRGDDDKSIRVGFSRIRHVGPVATRALLAAQPFSSIEDMRERVAASAVDRRTVAALQAVGALEPLGVDSDHDEALEFFMLGFTLHPPSAFEGIKPQYAGPRTSERWEHLGLTKGLEYTPARKSVSKLFWIPPLDDSREYKSLKLAASPWARVKTYLMIGLDVNGIPFHIATNEDKPQEANYLKFIVKEHKGSVICMDGAIRQPFERGEPLMFRFYDVTGSIKGSPQVWVGGQPRRKGAPTDKQLVDAFSLLHKRKRAARGN